MRGEWVLRLLSQKGVNYGCVGGGLPSVVKEDVLRALSANGIVGFEFEYLMAYLGGDADEVTINRLELDAYIWASGISAKNRWKLIKKKEVLRPCVKNVVRENLRPILIMCKKCNGTGRNKKMLPCGSCDHISGESEQTKVGNGIKRPKCSFYCELLGVSKSQWFDVWADRHDVLSLELNNLIERAASAASKTVNMTRRAELEMTSYRHY